MWHHFSLNGMQSACFLEMFFFLIVVHLIAYADYQEEKKKINCRTNKLVNTKAYSLPLILQRNHDYPTGCHFFNGLQG